MTRHITHPLALVAVCAASLFCGACATSPDQPNPAGAGVKDTHTELEVQAVVMKLADEYILALAEAMEPITNNVDSPRARRAAAGVRQRSTASALDIASRSNPSAALLDLLVLASLQRWSLEHHPIDDAIPPDMQALAAQRLARNETDMWKGATVVLSAEQRSSLHALITEWIKANPDQRLVSLVRFDEFLDVRNANTLGTRAQAEGLFREVGQATTAVDSARLYGERALWFAARYPLILGLQAEMVAFRAADQPEFKGLMEIAPALRQLSANIDSIDPRLSEHQEAVFARLGEERTRAIDYLSENIARVARDAADDMETRFANERKVFLDDLESRADHLRAVTGDIRDTVNASTELAKELHAVAGAADQIAAHFDQPGGGAHGPIEIQSFRDLAADTSRAAQEVAALLDKVHENIASDDWGKQLSSLDRTTAGVIDRAFWRGLVLVLVLVGGMGFTRLIPQRTRAQ